MAKRKVLSGFDAFLNDLHGFVRRKAFRLKVLREEAVVAEKAGLAAARLSDRELRERLRNSREEIRLGHDVLFEAMGLICECAYRALGIRPYLEQIMGALAVNRNLAIQMQTGEGKTITAAVAATLVGWRGGPCHIVTSNDYLARRDAESMAPLYRMCGLSVGYVIGMMPPAERKAAYDCDITYSTSKELLADFLRDRMAEEAASAAGGSLIRRIATGLPDGQVMRGLHTAIVDEADSVLADEATVPLIISVAGKNRLMKEAVMAALALARELKVDEDYEIRKSALAVWLTPQGEEKIDRALKGLSGIWSSFERMEYLITQALTARHFYHRDVHYVVYEGKVVIVDDKTGRMMEGRSWSAGLHQAVEAKEGIELTDVTESHIQMSFQLFFRLYRNLSGMSGTLQNIERELWSIYGLVAVKIPTHVPKQIRFHPERICLTAEEKWEAVTEDIVARISQGRAVLVGTRSIRESEAMFVRLENLGISATVLNALYHEQEATIIAQAGKRSRVTIATNMAGRGTDILVDRDVIAAGGLHVIATERHESRRVDMQLFGRTARQGMPGSGQMVVSLEDEVIVRFAPVWFVKVLRRIVHTALGGQLAWLCYVLFQYRAEKAISRLRRKILMRDMDLSKALSFTKY
jgi:preprotein translocase subunit SecA